MNSPSEVAEHLMDNYASARRDDALEAAMMAFPDARTPQQERLAQDEHDRREAEREAKVQDLTREMMRDPDQETLDFIADCNSHFYPELALLCCKAIYAPGEFTRLDAISQMYAMLHPQFETAASYKLLERT